jgi:hypothetical protein
VKEGFIPLHLSFLFAVLLFGVIEMRYLVTALIAVILGIGVVVAPYFNAEGSVSDDFCKNPQKPCTLYIVNMEKN